MQSLVEMQTHCKEGEVTVWEEVRFELSQRFRTPEATLAFISLFSVVLAVFPHLLGCLGASHGYSLPRYFIIALFLLLVPWDLPESGSSTVGCFPMLFLPACLSSPSLDWVASSLIISSVIYIVGTLYCCRFTETQAGHLRVLAQCFGLIQAELSFYSGPAVSW